MCIYIISYICKITKHIWSHRSGVVYPKFEFILILKDEFEFDLGKWVESLSQIHTI